ncbi:hypothetical protein KKG31_00290 [Patescibacteria group bacterium]|nr:hypothetical protein [Patescibacteria group bacterium]MBU1757629.1 hypothetical protein [Patescibacteria group bacterium]
MVTWDGTEEGAPVFVKTDDEDQYHLDILERKMNLNSAAIGALMAGFVLGQQSFYHILTIDEEQALKEKFDKLETYQDINENIQEEEQREKDKNIEKPSEKKEKTEIEKFYEERGKLDGYKFGDKEKDK